MRILQLLPRFPWPLKDGGALGYYNDSKAYAESGCELTLAVLNTSKHFIKIDELPEHVRQLGDIHLSYIDNRIKPIPAFINLFFTHQSYHAERFLSKAFESLLIKLCQQKTFDVVVFESIYMAPYIDIIRAHSKALCILKEHNVEFDVWKTVAQTTSNPIKKWYLDTQVKRLQQFEVSYLNRFDGILTVTQNDQNTLRAHGCTQPMHVSPAGIDITRLQPDTHNIIPNSIFHIGSMDWMPNQHSVSWFIEQAWPLVRQKHPELHFYVAGRHTPESFARYDGQNQVHILGEVEDAIQFMNQRLIMVVPLFSGSGIRVKILEGMALGKCIITTPLGCQGIQYEESIDMLIANDAEEFSERIDRLITHPELQQHIQMHARKRIEDVYDNKRIIQNTLAFYHSLKS